MHSFTPYQTLLTSGAPNNQCDYKNQAFLLKCGPSRFLYVCVNLQQAMNFRLSSFQGAPGSQVHHLEDEVSACTAKFPILAPCDFQNLNELIHMLQQLSSLHIFGNFTFAVSFLKK